MDGTILMLTSIEGAANCAAAMTRLLGREVELAESRKAALAALRRKEYLVLIVDDTVAEGDEAAADALWKAAGMAVPLQVNFAISGVARLVREVRAVLARREQEKVVAMRAAAAEMKGELRSTVAGLLLQSQLALAEPAVPPNLAAKLRVVVDLAGNLRQQLNRAEA